MQLLLPPRFKKIGTLILPFGLVLWVLMQKKVLQRIVEYFIGQPEHYGNSAHYIVNVSAAVIGIFSFFFGLYFIAFSKERKEDEMVRAVRTESFQFAAFTQLALVVASLVLLLILGDDPRKETMLLYVVSLMFLFWFVFIVRFNYLLHIKYKK